jgi:hypothetical protein
MTDENNCVEAQRVKVSEHLRYRDTLVPNGCEADARSERCNTSEDAECGWRSRCPQAEARAAHAR